MTREASRCVTVLLLAVLHHPVHAGISDEEAIRKQIAEIKQAPEQKWQRIPWVASLSDARRLSQKDKRPVFLFTYDGNLDTGRC